MFVRRCHGPNGQTVFMWRLLCTVAQRITDYSSGSACGILHLALVQACQKSTKCKRFIPSEFGANLETHPHFANPFLHPVMDLLRSQTEVKWTTQAIGWLADYLVPRTNRYHPDIGPMHPLDHSTKTMTIPEDGKYPVSVVSARDFAKALASILASETKWRNVIHVQADRKSWLEMAELLKTNGGIPQLIVEFEDLAPYQKISENPDAPLEDTILALMKMFAASGGTDFDQQTIEHDRADYFLKMHLRTVQELLTDAKTPPDAVL